MKLAISTALLVLLAGLPAAAWQEPQQDKEKDKPAKQEQPKKQEPEKQKAPAQEKERQQTEKQQEKTQKQEAPKPESKKEQKDQAKQNEKTQKEAAKQQQQSDKDRANQDRAVPERKQQAQQDNSNARQAQRDGGNRNVRRISDPDFRAHFGREHHFHIHRGEDRRFSYGGYAFELSEPWPAGWSYDDDVYIDDSDDDYYLIDPVHPGIRILVIVVG